MPNKNVYDISHSNVSINENSAINLLNNKAATAQSNISINGNSAVNLLNNKASTVQGPMDENNKIKSQKVGSMEMLMNNGDILTTTMIEHEQAKENHKKLLYARAIH